MKAVKIQFFAWEKPFYADAQGLALNRGDWVVFKQEDSPELALVSGFEDVDIEKFNQSEGSLRPIMRLASEEDISKLIDDERRDEVLGAGRELVHRFELEMKLVDVHQSYDGSKITIAFIADGRVDFRELVKELTRKLNRTIRLQQIGIRDEAKLCGDCGHCGRQLCCRGHLTDFISITSDMAEAQQCEHRGSDRISGCCGRLMCCLSYEEKGYRDTSKNMPEIGSMVNVDGRRGEVINRQILKRSVQVKFPDKEARNGYVIVEVDLDRNKKKK